MTKMKNTDNGSNNQEAPSSQFSPSTTLNSWSNGDDNNDPRERDIAWSRSREMEMRPRAMTKSRRTFALTFPEDKIPADKQYMFATERLLGEPQGDNIQNLYEDGWEFVRLEEHPEYKINELYQRSDNCLRKRNTIMMKKPKIEYQETQQEAEEDALRKQREGSYMTDAFGAAPGDPRFIKENTGSYTPAYQQRWK